MTDKKPIGVLDSGVGGLSVLKNIREECPFEDLIYVADSGYAPYGDKPPGIIENRVIELTKFLAGLNVKAIVIACNTATAVAVSKVRAMLSLPVVAMEPALKPAVKITKSGIVGILATSSTLNSKQFKMLFEQFGGNVEVIAKPCPGLVEKVESAEFEGKEIRNLLEGYLNPLKSRGVDTVVLGCTHYPFLLHLIKEIMGEGVEIIDTGKAVSRQLTRILELYDLWNGGIEPGKEQFWTSNTLGHTYKVMSRLWKKDLVIKRLPEYLL